MTEIKKKVDSDWKKKAEEDKAKLEEAKEKVEEAAKASEGPLPPPTFTQFLAGLDLEARLTLGELKHPVSGEVRQDLDSAQYVIDTIALIQEKTKGNLETDEEILLQNLLTELRFRFVEAKRKKGA